MIAAFNSLDSLSLHHGTLIGVINTLGSAVRGLTSLEITPAQQEAVGLPCNTRQ